MTIAFQKRVSNRGFFSKEALCSYLGVSSNGHSYYVESKQEQEAFHEKVLRIVDAIRRRQPEVGTRKLYRMLKKRIYISRDKLFALLRSTGRLITRKARKTKKKDVPEMVLAGVELTGPDQGWVADGTFLTFRNGEKHLAWIVTDYYSRKIIGYHLHTDQTHKGTLKAFQMACKQAKGLKGIIHHSDKGSQYLCGPYQKNLKKKKMKASFTGKNRCYDNAVAERVNGILKHEFGLKTLFNTIDEATKALKQAVYIYNYERLHMSLDYKTPAEIHGR